MKSIQINSAIFPKVMQIIVGKPQSKNNIEVKSPIENEPDLIIDLPRSAYLTYLKTMALKGSSTEFELLKKYADGILFTDADFEEAIKLIMFVGERNNHLATSNDFLAPFGICVDRSGEKSALKIISTEEARLRAETWEYIIIDILKKSAFEIVECFDFESSFVRTNSTNSNEDSLQYSLMAWKFSIDEAEQNLSSALRAAFMFTLIGYCYGDNSNNYTSFQEYFDSEFFKRVSLIYGIWNNRKTNSQVKYIPLYDSFHNLSGENKNYLIEILRSVLDDSSIALDEKQILKNRLIDGAGAIHNGTSSSDVSLEQILIKPVVNFIMLREKAKETLETVRLLCSQGYYSDCANRCYYAMMYSLKALLEYNGELADWKSGELKEPETHQILEQKLSNLVSRNILSQQDENDFNYVKDQRWKCDYSLYKFSENDARCCLRKAETFYTTVESITR